MAAGYGGRTTVGQDLQLKGADDRLIRPVRAAAKVYAIHVDRLTAITQRDQRRLDALAEQGAIRLIGEEGRIEAYLVLHGEHRPCAGGPAQGKRYRYGIAGGGMVCRLSVGGKAEFIVPAVVAPGQGRRQQ